MPQPVNQDAVHAVVSAALTEWQAQLQDSAISKPANFVKIGPIPLDTAPVVPYELPTAFSSIVMKDATDSSVRVQLILHANTNYAIGNAYPMDQNEPINFKKPVARGFLTWTAQPGKTATLYLATDAEIRPGKIQLTQTGNVVVGEGAAFGAPDRLNVVGLAAAVALFAANTLRTVSSMKNISGATVYVGTAGVTDATGWPVQVGEEIAWRNAAALFIYCPVNASVARLEETSS